MQERLAGRVHYAWIVAGVAFVDLVMAAGFRSATAVLFQPLHDTFGWSHAAVSLAILINFTCYAIAAPLAAGLIERYGLRLVIVAAIGTIAVSSLLSIGMSQVWQLVLLWGFVNGFATGCVASPIAAIVAARWFQSRRGLVTGALGASNASGQLVFLPLLAWLAGYDWRYAPLAVAAAALLLVLPLTALLLRDQPHDLGLVPYGADPATHQPPARVSGNPFRPAFDGLRLAVPHRAFWLLAVSFFICGVTTFGMIGTHLIPAAHDHGIGEVKASGLLALMGVFDIVGTTVSGWLTDRHDSRYLLLWYYGLRGLSLLALPFALRSQPALLPFAIVYGLDWVATVPPTVALTVQWFGRERVGVVFAWIFAAHQLGAAVASAASGAVRTLSGAYDGAFYAGGVLAVLAGVLALGIARRAVSAGPPAPAPAPG